MRHGPAILLEQARADGLAVDLLPEGKLCFRGSRAAADKWVPTLRAMKPALLAYLAGEAATVPAPPPCPADIAERAAVLAEAAAIEPAEADARAFAEVGLADAGGLAQRWADSNRAELARLPAPCSRDGARLLEVTLAFLDSSHWGECVAAGWPIEHVFGVDPLAPRERFERWGLAVSLAWSPHDRRGSDGVWRRVTIESIGDAGAVLTMPSGSRLRFDRFRPALQDAVPWWESGAMVAREGD